MLSDTLLCFQILLYDNWYNDEDILIPIGYKYILNAIQHQFINKK